MIRHAGEAIILVTHGAALMALLAALTGDDLGELWRTRRLRHDNSGVSVVLEDLQQHKRELLISNSRSQLANLLTGDNGWPA